MPKVELIYDNECPNVEAARNELRRAFAAVGIVPHWDEWERTAPTSPPYARDYGSPAILVNGRDVAGAAPVGGANCCRVYHDETGRIQGVPSSGAILWALQNGRRSTKANHSRNWQASLSVVPAVAISLLPNLACPACWPAYAGLLSAMGLGSLTESAYLLPLTALFLSVAVGALAFRADRRRGYAPFMLGGTAAAVILIGKFAFTSDGAMYGGIVALIGASLWNAWPKTSATAQVRRACCSTEQLHQISDQ